MYFKEAEVRAQLRFLMEMSLPALIYQNLTLDDRSQAAKQPSCAPLHPG